MTKTEFFKALGECKGSLVSCYMIRIRIERSMYCPITAVCKVVCNRKYCISQWHTAGRLLKLDPNFVLDIMRAADNLWVDTLKEDKKLESLAKKMRRILSPVKGK